MLRSIEQTHSDPGYQQTQQRELKRVRSAIGQTVYDFCQGRLEFDVREFTMAELVAYVLKAEVERGRPMPAPDSPSRILRDLGKSGAIRYTLLSRRHSLYRVDAVDHSKL